MRSEAPLSSPESFEPNVQDRDSTPDFAELKAKSSRRRMLMLGALGFTFVGAVGAWVKVESDRAQREADGAAAELRGCLFGGHPLEQGETAWQRMRRLQLRSVSYSERERVTKAAEIWPMACRGAATKAQDVLKTKASAPELTAFEKLGKVLSEPSAMSLDVHAAAAPVLAALDTHLPGDIPANGPALPPLVMDIDAIAKIPPLSKRGNALGKTFTEDNPGLALPVLVADQDDPVPFLCMFESDSAAARCSTVDNLKGALKHGLRLLGTSESDSPPLIFAGRRGSAGVYIGQSATLVDSLYSYGGHVSADGTASVLGWDADKRALVLVNKAPNAEATRTVLEPNFTVGNYFYSSQLLWDVVLVRGVTPDNERRLFTMPLSNQAPDSFALEDIGELPEAGLIRSGEEEQTHLTGCRTKDATVVRVRGIDRDFVAFRIDGKFSMLRPAPTWGVLGCHGTTAAFTEAGYASGGTTLHHASCTAAGCTVKDFKREVLDRNTADLRPTDEREVDAVDVGGKLLAVWIAGENGGLRMRMAEPEMFERTEDVVLFDDRTEGGKKRLDGSLLGFKLYSREKFAVLLVSSLIGVHAFRIDTNGTIKPFELAPAK